MTSCSSGITSQNIDYDKDNFEWVVSRQWLDKGEIESPAFYLEDSSLEFTFKLKCIDDADEHLDYWYALWIYVTKNKPFIFGSFYIYIYGITSTYFRFNNKQSGDYFLSEYHKDLFRHRAYSDAFSIVVKWNENKNAAKEFTDKTLGKDLSWLLEDAEFSDVVIVTEDGTQLPVHKNILSARSPVFLAMLKSGMREASDHCIKISDLSTDTVKSMVKYLYTGRLPEFNFDAAVELLKAADKYDVPHLKQACVEYLMLCLKTSNALDLLLIMDAYNEDGSKKILMQYISENRKRFSEPGTFDCLKGNPNLLAELLCTSYQRRVLTSWFRPPV